MAAPVAQKMGGNLAQRRSNTAAQCKRMSQLDSQAIANNFELQNLMLSTIENYQSASPIAQEAGKSLAETIKTKQKRGEGTKSEISQSGSAAPSAIGRRSVYSDYSQRGKKMLEELLHFTSEEQLDAN
eukprot:6405185-Amphidinium_carterae.1